MKKYLYLCLFIIVVFFQPVSVYASKDYNNRVLSLIDENEGTFLLRGKHPEHQGKFAYDQLRTHIMAYLNENGKQIPEDFTLICVSLLNPFERSEWKMEKDWFRQNVSKDFLLHYPLYGCLFNPCRLTPPVREIFYSFDLDGMRSLTCLLKQLMDARYGEQSGCVIYMHCFAGKDRTAEAASCYLMQYKGYSYREAVYQSQLIAKRKLRTLSLNAIRWYAFHLRDIHYYPTIGMID